MKKTVLIVNIILALMLAAMIFARIPITKLSTDDAMRSIEKHYLRADLADQEKENYAFLKSWVLRNQDMAIRCWHNAWALGLAASLLFMLNNFYILISRNEIDRKQPLG